MHVFLFDIDGTLIDSGGAGQAAMREALGTLFGIESPSDVPVHGQTDRGIAGNLFRAHDLDDSQENWDRLRNDYVRRLSEHLPQRRGRVLDGVAPLLEELAKMDEVTVGLLTGNVHDGARVKLEYFGLFHHFRFGGYGDHHPCRDDVARQALTAAREHLNGQVVTERVWVIGDTPFDIRCARAIGARVAAVTTGIHRHDDLASEKPDLLLDGLTDTARLMSLIR